MEWVLGMQERGSRMLCSFLAQATEWIMESFMEIGNSGDRVKFRGKVMRFILDMLS